MDGRKAISRGTGGAVAIATLVYGWLVKGDEARGVLEMLEGSWSLIQEWGWLPLFVFSVAVVVWGDPSGWRIFGRSPSKFMRLSEALEYVADRSIWAVENENSGTTGEWVTLIQRDFKDALGTSEITARGRRPTSGNVSHNGAEPIPSDFWPKSMLIPVPRYDAATRDGVYGPGKDGRELAYVDVTVERRAVRRKWRPALPWERPHKSPWQIANVQERRASE